MFIEIPGIIHNQFEGLLWLVCALDCWYKFDCSAAKISADFTPNEGFSSKDGNDDEVCDSMGGDDRRTVGSF